MKNLLLNVQHLSIKKQTFIFTPNKYLLFTQFFLSSSHLLTLKSKFETVGWSKGTVFFTYKPSDFFSIWHKRLGDFFTRNGVRLIAEGLGFKKKSTNLPLMQNDHKFCDCSALFFLLCIFPFISCCAHWAISQFFPLGSLTQMACYNQEFCSGLIPDGFPFSLGQRKSVGRSLPFRVAAYNWDWLIGEEIQYIVTLIPCKSASHFVSDYKSSDYSGIFYHIV